MHGTVQLEGRSCKRLRRSSSQHMRSVHPLVITNSTVTVVGDHHSSPASSIITTATSDSFLKDGRKICVGDCALFKPPQASPPFIGLIRRLTLSKNNNLQLGVNWLYRPAELDLGKGIVVEGAPNEIFYSFHKDEISAASLLHPCKVAFLPQSVELPSGTSSLVCRRVYDIANKCLWWLTDQDYINEQQEEVDQLLYKTSTEMHAKLQPGGRSPKQVNGPGSTSQLKPASGFGQNSGTNLHSQVKGKKRERGDHRTDPVKRERPVRTNDGDSFQCKTESNLKSEIARITEKGGVIDLEGVEKLVQLMQQDRMERKLDLISRSMLAGVVAATNKDDCLNRFVQLRGIPVLDEWLQDLQKVKIGDGNNYKETDKCLEEFLLVLLRALDKLPVNLHTLQMCNIGRSVNHLRSHKNFEIQRKARGLVDTWKKRVEAEMNSVDAKSGSTQAVSMLPSKSRLPEASHGMSRTTNGSDVVMKSSVTHNSANSTSVMSSHGESNVKSATSSPGPVKSVSSPSSVKESSPRISVGGTADVPQDSTYLSSRVSSPGLSDKHEQFERTPGDKSDASDMNVESLKSSKDVLMGCAQVAGSPAVPDEEQSMTIQGPPTNHFKSGKLHTSSFSPMNALVESCAKYSEANTSLSLEDDVGMNLLASVAAGEMSRSDLVSPTDSMERSAPAVEEVCNDDEAKSKSAHEGYIAGVQHQSYNGVESDDRKQVLSHASEDFTAGDGNKHIDSSSTDVRSADQKREVNEKSNEKTDATSLTLPISKEKVRDGELNEEIHEEKTSPGNVSANGALIRKSRGTDDIMTEEKASIVEAAESNDQKDADEGSNMETSNSPQKSMFGVIKSELIERGNNEKLQQTGDSHNSMGKAAGEINVGEPDENDAKCCLSKSERLNFDMEVDRNAACESRGIEEANLEKESLKCSDSKSANTQPDEADELVSAVAEVSSTATRASDVDTKMEFDLNEGFSADEGKYVETVNLMSSGATTPHMISSLPFSMNSIPSSYSGSITVAAAAKGPFVPPEDLLRSKGDLGWKGSAATSAFRPAEPRKVLETPGSSTCRHGRMPLDIDLNVPDERLLEEMASRDSALAIDSSTDFASVVRSSGMLDLDLNRTDEANDNGNCSTSTNPKGDGSFVYVKSLGGIPNGEASRDFDLNDGPCVDDFSAEQFPTNQQVPASIPSQLPTSGVRINNPGLGNFASWFSPCNTYSTGAIPSMLHDRPEHAFPVFPPNAPQRIFGPSGATQFTPDIYRSSILSSSPAMPFPSSPFQFPVFPFGTTFPLPSATFPVGATSYVDASSGSRLFAPPVHSQLLGPVGSVTSQFQRPFLIGLPDSNNNGVFDSDRRWGRQGLDLNAGPGAMETEVRGEMLHRSSSQHSAANSQPLAEEQARRYSVSGTILKRKEQEGGWENDSFRSKQSSWQ